MNEPGRSPIVLAVDTATSLAAVALCDSEGLLVERSWRAGRGHTTRLLIELDSALALVQRSVQDVAAIAVIRGPGSFTGVRVGLSLAKGLAFGLGARLWGYSALDVLARAGALWPGPIRPVIELGRGRFATALYGPGQLGSVAQAVSLAELKELSEGDALLIGDVPATIRTSAVHVAPPPTSTHRAGYLAHLAWDHLAGSRPTELMTLDALYALDAAISVS